MSKAAPRSPFAAPQSPGIPSRLLPLLLGLLLIALLTGCGQGESLPRLDTAAVASETEIAQATAGSTRSEAYSFSFDLRISPSEDARQYLPLIEYLERQTGLPFRLDFRTDSHSLEQGFIRGEVDFAIIGAGSYLALLEKTDILPLVRGLNAEGEPGYRAYLVTLPDSPLQGISSLRGKTLALGSRTSTQGYLIPRIMLAQAGIDFGDLAAHEFTGSHRACAEAVIRGDADACGMQDILARRLIEAGELRALAISEVFPSSGIFASARVPAEVRERVRKALIAFDPVSLADRLYHWERTEMAGGFTAASADDYTLLKRWKQRFDNNRAPGQDRK